MTAFYNDNDPKVCRWLNQLCKRGLIAKGDISSDSIRYLDPDRLREYKQVHLFAGIGGWSYALRLAGWPDDQPVWTGSCPCQPFSSAGKRLGTADKRHLWPVMFRLIRECRPNTIFGEQVESAIRQGWLDGVFTDLEGEGYTCGAVVLGAHSVGAPHIRQRLFWVADAGGVRSQRVGTAKEEPWPRQQLEGLVQAEVRTSVPTGKSGGLSHGLPARVVRLRGYGNAIVPQVAAVFIRAFMESTNAH